MNQKNQSTSVSSASTGDSVAIAAESRGRLQRLEQLARLGVLSASAAHEIKNALIPVRTFVDLLLEQNPASELAGVVRRELTRINELVSQMLRLAQPNRTSSKVSLHAVLDDSLRLVAGQAKEKGVLVEKRYQAGSDCAFVDRNQLEQVFLNLLLNAVEAMDSGGRLTVTTQSRADGEVGHICIGVSDTGQGIAEQDLEQIFTPFFTTKQDGTGLGLAIAKNIVTEHSGEISVHSTVGSGTTFMLKLPVTTRASS